MPLISIAGSQGSGKSSLLSSLPYPSISRKTSRSILSDWGVTLSEVNNNRDLTIKFQDEVLKRKIEDEQPAVDSPELFLTERTPIDLLTYAVVAIGKDNEYSDWLDDYASRCITATCKYVKIAYLPSGYFSVAVDGVRGVNSFYSLGVDAMMLRFYETYTTQGQLHIINTGSLSDRVQAITKLVNDCS